VKLAPTLRLDIEQEFGPLQGRGRKLVDKVARDNPGLLDRVYHEVKNSGCAQEKRNGMLVNRLLAELGWYTR